MGNLDLARFYSGFPAWEQRGYTQEEMEEIYWKDGETKLNYLLEVLNAGREEDAAELINFHFGNSHFFKTQTNSQKALLFACNRFKNKHLLFNLIVSVYTNDGYFFPRKIIKLAKQLAKDIPESERLKDLPAGDPVTVYRGSYTRPNDLNAIRAEPSWTTDKDVAIFFAYKTHRERRDHNEEYPAAHLYQAEIPRSKIIAYLTDRNESEVLQHCNVKNIRLLAPPSEEEVTAVFEAHRQSIKKQWQDIAEEYGEEAVTNLKESGLIL